MTTPHPLLLTARDLAPLVRAHADESEGLRHLAPAIVEAFRPTGLFRMAVPRAYGGPEIEPLSMLEVIEEVSRADGAAGWCVNISSTTSSLSGYLKPEWARIVFADPLEAYGGAFAPNGKGRWTGEGWNVDGRWMWGSGTSHCAWINGGVITDKGEMRLMFFERPQVEFLDTWYSSGLRGTGSTDYEVHDAFVPEGREVWVGKVWAQVDSPVSRFPNFNLLAAGLGSVCLGIAARAVDEIVSLLAVKPVQMSRSKAADYPPAQMAVAQAEAILGGARAFLFSEVAKVWEAVLRGDRPDASQKARLRLAAAQAATESAKAVDLCYNAGGGSSVFASNPLQRCFRDIHTATQHMMLSDKNMMTFGRLRLGLETDVALL